MNEEEKPNNPPAPAAPAPPPPPAQPAAQDAGSPSGQPSSQSIYPAYSANQQAVVDARNGVDEKADGPAFSEKTNDAITLICGLASSICYILIYYWVKNYWATAVICLGLSGAAIYFALKNYKKTQNVTPLEVIGISAATITLVYVGTMIVTEMIIRSQINSLYR